jgi:two-component system response regulator HydG
MLEADVRISDLDLRELLEFEPSGGVIRFAGHRAIILDTAALGLLRRQLIETLGQTAARAMLLKFGFAHGWRTAEALKADFPWEDESEWRRAGGRLHTLQGLVIVDAPARVAGDPTAPFAEALWRESYEAEQHLLHFGRADESVCWTLTGFASGYMSCCNGKDIVCIEDRCVGKGDAACHVVGRTREEWGEHVEPSLSNCAEICLESTLQGVVTELKRTEQKLRRKKHALAQSGSPIDEPSGLVARSEPMQRVLTLARRVAKVDSTVLITGESGVGKERLSRLVHDESTRAAGPFVAVNCAAMTETLLESELFGHIRGSFTGATHDHPGLFEAANGGTIFLDEIGEVTAGMQAKLLRVLQEREVRRVGENKSRPVNVRVVAATNRDLNADVLANHFRKDLYYRLRVVELRIPALRERRDDILPLARVLLQAVGERMGRRVSGLSARAADQLLRYDWPGNVRELENTMERAVALAEGERVEVEDLPEEIRSALPGAFAPGQVRTLDDVERDYILAALHSNDGHQGKTAAQLGIGTATLYRKLKSYQVRA